MKRILLAILILTAGTTVFCALRNASANIKTELAGQTAVWQAQTQQLARLRSEKQRLLEVLKETKQLLADQPQPPARDQLADKILSGGALQHLSSAETEQLLAELGFNWNTTGDYVIVSKKSLEGISFDCLKGMKLTSAARDIFAITPDEQATIEAMTRQLVDGQTAWAREHVQRTEPGGDVLAQYSLPADPGFSQSQLSLFTNGIFSALGPERAQWLQDHSTGWMEDFGLHLNPNMSKIPAAYLASMPASFFQTQSEPTTLTVKRYKAGDEWQMDYTLARAGSSMTAGINPWQPFPETFSFLFPGGWKELAQREGFELPREFNQP